MKVAPLLILCFWIGGCATASSSGEGILTKTYHYADGSLMVEEPYRDGKLDGVVKIYYQEGALWREESFKENELHGPYKVYYRNGALKMEKQFKDGKAEGIGRQYDPNEKLRALGTYRDGKLIHLERYDEAGNLIVENESD